jgi:Asp-tRNA(Asn)/Glu-tRNA(Gln) amidotransferase A subunit family amidase
VRSAPFLKTLTQWMGASPEVRERALREHLQRVGPADESIHAWVQVSPQEPTGHGDLWMIPFGAKDIIETAGLATEYGSPLYKGRIGSTDAAIVAELRRRGAVLFGKTRTTAFAYRTPAATRNPRNPLHTPGGSSSGSAAAVAAGMVPFALGTQTQGSVLRPASYCGVTGFKPGFAVLPMEGVLPLAPSLDTLGFFAHTPADMLALWEALGYTASPVDTPAYGVVDPLPEMAPAMRDAFTGAVAAMSRHGLDVRGVDLTVLLDRLNAASRTVMAFEAARVHDRRFNLYGAELDIADLVKEGRAIDTADYHEATSQIRDARAQMTAAFEATPILLTPAATGAAPRGLASTGDPRMNAPWTALGGPAMSIPMPGSDGLPLGLQLAAGHGQEARLLHAAIRVQAIIGGGGDDEAG